MTRPDEYKSFLEWLLRLLEKERPDALLVSGDVFDTGTPGEKTRELYCEFLSRADATGCRQIIITAGNHDGVAQLEVSKPLLRRHHCVVVTHLNRDTAEECLVPILNDEGEEQGLVCAVPFLRPNEVSLPQAEEERQYSYVRGVAAVYERVAELAAEWKAAHPGLPVVAMGHLAVVGAEPTAATRPLIGTLDVVEQGIFSPVFDYVALGHIHKPTADTETRVLYSGSPLAIGLDEAAYEHRVLLVDLACGERHVRAVEVEAPVRYVKSVCRQRADLESEIERLRQSAGAPVWLWLEYHGADITTAELNNMLREALPREVAPVIRAMRVRPTASGAGRITEPSARLADYTPEYIFRRALDEYMDENPGTEDKRNELTQMFRMIMSELQNN